MVNFRVFVAVALGFGLAACQTVEESWTEWEVISEDQSQVRLIASGAEGIPEIRRAARRNTADYVRQEHWEWGSGKAYMTLLPKTMYSREEVHDENVIIEDMKHWQTLEKIELKADVGMVKQNTNKIGVFHYLVSDRNNAGMTCFVFRQMLPTRGMSGYQDITHGSQGFLAAYDCQPSDRVTRERFTQQMMAYVQNFEMGR